MMKNFFKTWMGKTTLFILINIFITTIALSYVSATVMVKEEFYTRAYDSLHEEVVNNILERECSRILDYIGISNKTIDYGNIIFKVEDSDGNVVLKSNSYKNDEELRYCASISDEYPYHIQVKEDLTNQRYDYLIFLDIDESLEYFDETALILNVFNLLYSLKYSIYIIAVVSLILLVISFVELMSVSGRRKEDADLHAGPISLIPIDLLILLVVILIAIEFGIIGLYDYNTLITLIGMIVLFYSIVNAIIGLSYTVAYRIKSKQLLKNSIIYKVCALILRIIKKIVGVIGSLKLIKKTVLCLLIYIPISIILFGLGGFGFVINLLSIICITILIALNLKVLQEGGEKIAMGDFEYKINTSHLFGDFKKHGDNLNSLSCGMERALNEKLKSERMKTELITNVSHDIKTPLTSIINYASLIKDEKDEDKVKEYSEVLIKQSDKLKKLIEDLIEASKASTGNLEVNLSKCEASEFLKQIAGEYEEKFAEKNLVEVCDYPLEKLYIMADGRRMWRVFDNLMNNIYKYALEGTRVYLSLEKEDDTVIFSFKNTSKEQLNISPDELMERFTRGDSSRNTSGNGLGLSIAKSMAQLQGGDLKLQIDGDLFKATLKFPLVENYM